MKIKNIFLPSAMALRVMTFASVISGVSYAAPDITPTGFLHTSEKATLQAEASETEVHQPRLCSADSLNTTPEVVTSQAATSDTEARKRILCVGRSGAGITPSINALVSALHGDACQFIIPIVSGKNSYYPPAQQLLTTGIEVIPYRDVIAPQDRRVDLGSSDTPGITGYVVTHPDYPTFELIDIPGFNNNSGASTGKYWAINQAIYNAVRDEIILNQIRGQPIDAIVFVLAALPGRSGYHAQDSNHSNEVIRNHLLAEEIQHLIKLFPQDVVNTNFFFLCNKQKSEADTARIKREVRQYLPHVQDDRFIEVGVYDAIFAHEAQSMTDAQRAALDEEERVDIEYISFRYQKALPAFKILAEKLAGVHTPLRTLGYSE